MKEIKVRTTMAVIANRVFVNGEADIPAARAVQAGFHMLPLSVFQRQGLKYEMPKTDPATSGVRADRAGASATLRPDRLRHDALSVHKRRLRGPDGGVVPSDRPERREGIRSGRRWMRRRSEDWRARPSPRNRSTKTPTRIQRRSSTAGATRWAAAVPVTTSPCGPPSRRICWAPTSPSSCSIPTPEWTIENQPLSGANKYVLRFEKDKMPPVSVFWNLSMYDDKEFFIENDFKRYSIGSTTDGLKTDADGSITIYIQHENPGVDKQSNWLPAPPRASI